jgi:hypothetical protein
MNFVYVYKKMALNPIKVKVKKLTPEAKIPFIGSYNAAGFDIYSKIIQWRIHNISERILVKPKTEDYLLGYIEGLRAILKDKTKIEKLYQQFKKK